MKNRSCEPYCCRRFRGNIIVDRIIVIMMLFALVGCTSLKPVIPVSYRSIQQNIGVGDELVITLVDGGKRIETFVAATPEGLYVKSPAGSVFFAFSQIQKIEKRAESGGSTVGYILLGTALGLLLIVAAGSELMRELGSD